ncbi:MAG: signal recognition particle-docking protein FtsY [Candidatus Dormibacteria bacterium]
MADPEAPSRRRWWRRLPGRLDRLGPRLRLPLLGVLAGRALDESLYEELTDGLIAADCGVALAGAVIEELRQEAARERWRSPDQLLAALRAQLLRRLERGDRELRVEGEPAVWLVAGVNGSGKTTTVAKLAARLEGQGVPTLVAAADTFRAAAIDQLRLLCAPAGVELVAHQPGSDPAAVVYDALAAGRSRGRRVVLVDTAGRLHTKHNLMQELAKIHRVVAAQGEGQPVEGLLVLDAYAGANALPQARAFAEAIGATGVVLSKLDGSARGGYLFQVESELELPVKLIGTGEGLEDLADFEPEAYLDLLLPESQAP